MNSVLKCRCVQTSSRKKPSGDQFLQLTTSCNQQLNLHILGGNLRDVPLNFLLCLSNDVFNPSPIYFMRKSLFAEERSLKVFNSNCSFKAPHHL